ncbi:hypothetical protein G9A89_011350 [Geosiphon pyriformis]|nr:hypothetical protein G9A89_011350 [Geosiphon pyriformis]
MVNILETLQQANKELLNEIETLKKQLADKDQAISKLKERFSVNENNILTEEEIREVIGSLNRNPNESHIRAETKGLEKALFVLFTCITIQCLDEQKRIKKLRNIVDLEVKQKDLELEQKNHLEFVDVSEEWHKRRVFEMKMLKDGFITDLRLKIHELEKILIAKDEKLVELTKLIEPKPKKFQQIKKLVNTTKEKAHEFKEKVQEKFHAYILQKNK